MPITELNRNFKRTRNHWKLQECGTIATNTAEK